ncbi:hypothetical protein BDY24DRAFT_382392 [Mrakia frigida]|uniref:type-X family DNA polymerase n=1 Tax=Mrakia frigida TaxID=29902 RepID=UPI003FCC26BC
MGILASLRIFLLSTKIDPSDIRRLEAAVRIHGGGVVPSAGEADIVCTVLKGRQRIAMTVSTEIMNTKPLVNLRWLEDSFVHQALLDFRPYLVPLDGHPDPTDLQIPHALQQTTLDDDDSDLTTSTTSSSSNFSHRPPSPPLTSSSRAPSPFKRVHSDPPASFASPIPLKLAKLSLDPRENLPTPETFNFHPKVSPDKIPPPGKRIDPSSLPPLACHRKSPMVCVNQPLLDELAVLIKWKLIGEDHKEYGVVETHSLAYKRACAAIKAYPTKLQSKAEARKIPYVGEKLAALIGEFIKTGVIARAQILRNDSRLRLLLLFQTLHNVGPKTARDLYDKFHCRSLEDVYDVKPALRLEVEHWGELQSKIPRSEVEEIAEFVASTLERISPGCTYTICGGYRRGKDCSNDVDLIFTHELGDPSRVSRNVLDRLIEELTRLGALENLVSGAHIGDGGKRTTTLNHSFCVLKLPGEGRLRRRVDLILAAYNVYFCTVLGWTGSTMFERDIRRQAESLGLKFDSSGITNRTTTAKIPVDPKLGEKGIFDILGLEWLEPWERCADI